jgi:hypothetical protein
MLNCVLDGLDECEPTSLGWLLSKLDKIFARTAPSDTRATQSPAVTWGQGTEGMSSPAALSSRLRILVFSRAKTPPCLSVLFRYSHLSLEDHWKDREGGVARFVQHWFKQAEIDSKLARRIDFKHINTPEEMYDLDDADPVKPMVDKAEGSYLRVQLNIATLKRYDPRQSFDYVVKSLPAELEQIYERMADGIDAEPKPSQLLAARVLQWVRGAARPLRVEELAVVVDRTKSVGKRQKPRRCAEVDIHGLIASCNHFLEIHDNYVVLCHSSARDFFFEDSTKRKYRSPKVLAICCVEYKTHEDILGTLHRALQSVQADEMNWPQALGQYSDFLESSSKADDETVDASFVSPPELALAFCCLQYWPFHARLASSKYWAARSQDWVNAGLSIQLSYQPYGSGSVTRGPYDHSPAGVHPVVLVNNTRRHCCFS